MTLKTPAGIDQKVEDVTSGEINFYAVVEVNEWESSLFHLSFSRGFTCFPDSSLCWGCDQVSGKHGNLTKSNVNILSVLLKA